MLTRVKTKKVEKIKNNDTMDVLFEHVKTKTRLSIPGPSPEKPMAEIDQLKENWPKFSEAKTSKKYIEKINPRKTKKNDEKIKKQRSQRD